MYVFSILAASIFAIIGGPSVGKTSIIEHLGEHGNVTCPEFATEIIAIKMAAGNQTPWEDEGFELELFTEKVRREDSAMKQYQDTDHKIFVDRGLIDTLVYLEVNNKMGTDEHKSILKLIEGISLKDRYEAVFFVEPHNGTHFQACSGGVRHENTNESLRLAEMTRTAYENAGYTLIGVAPHLSIEERSLFILEEIQELRAQ